MDNCLFPLDPPLGASAYVNIYPSLLNVKSVVVSCLPLSYVKVTVRSALETISPGWYVFALITVTVFTLSFTIWTLKEVDKSLGETDVSKTPI